MKSVMVTGAGGYIGKHVISDLKKRGAFVIAIDRSIPQQSEADIYIAADILQDPSNALAELDHTPDVCLHLAWRDGFQHNNPSHMEDLSSHFRFLTYLAAQGVKQIAVMGSMHEVGYWEGAIDESSPCNPLSLYGVAKNALRESLFIALKDKPVVLQWLRGYYIIGDETHSQSIFGKLYRAAQEGQETFPFTSGTNLYDFISLEELSAQIATVVLQDEISGIINCCSGKPVSLGEKVEEFIETNDLSISLEYGAFPDRPYDSPGVWGDTSKIDTIMKQHISR